MTSEVEALSSYLSYHQNQPEQMDPSLRRCLLKEGSSWLDEDGLMRNQTVKSTVGIIDIHEWMALSMEGAKVF